MIVYTGKERKNKYRERQNYMKSFKIIISSAAAVGAVGIMAFSSFAASASSTAGVVTTASDPLTVRALADVSSAKAATLAKGTTVTLLSKTGSWWYVEYAKGKYGYCNESYITPLQSGEAGYVSTAGGNLNIRAAASGSADVVATLPNTSSLVVLSEKNGWSRVLYNGISVGYASSTYIEDYSDEGVNSYGVIALKVSDYKQYDSRWAKLSVGSSGKTMKAIGCVTTALAATESYRLGDSSLTPAVMLKKLSYNGSGDVMWPSNYQKYTGSEYLKKTYELLKSGKPVIFGAKNSYGKMHWVVVDGYTGSSTLTAGGFTVNDSGSESRKTLADLLSEYPQFYKLEHY